MVSDKLSGTFGQTVGQRFSSSAWEAPPQVGLAALRDAGEPSGELGMCRGRGEATARGHLGPPPFCALATRSSVLFGTSTNFIQAIFL